MVHPAGAASAAAAGGARAAATAAKADAPALRPATAAAATTTPLDDASSRLGLLPPPPPAGADSGPLPPTTRQKGHCTPPGRFPAFCRTVLRTARAQWFLLALLLSAGFAAAVPQLGASGGWLKAGYSVRVPAIVLVFLISGSGLKTAVLARAAANLPAHALVQGVSLGLTPLVGWVVGGALRGGAGGGLLPRPLADGIVVMACMPTTISTNVVYTDIAGGNESIALVNAVLGNLIGIFVSPAWITALVPPPAAPADTSNNNNNNNGNDGNGGAAAAAAPPPPPPPAPSPSPRPSLQAAVPYASVLGELGYLVLAPLVLGQLLQYFAPRAVAKVRSKANLSDVSSFCIVLIVWVSFCNTFAAARAGKGTPATAADAAAAFFLCAALLAVFATIAAAVSRLPVPSWGAAAAEAAEAGAQEQEAKKKAAAAAGGEGAAAVAVVATTTTTTATAAAAAAAAEEGRAPLEEQGAIPSSPRTSPVTPLSDPKPRAACACPWRPLPRADAVAVIVCGATKTLALGAPLISVMYGGSDDVGLVALPLVVYHALQCVVGAPLLAPLRRWRHGEARWFWGPRREKKAAAARGAGAGVAAGGGAAAAAGEGQEAAPR